MDLDLNVVDARKTALDQAIAIVTDAAEKFPLEDIRSTTNLVNGYTVTKFEQFLDGVIRVADWLIGKDE